MAKYKPKNQQRETGQTITTKSRYGSHSDMVIVPTGEIEKDCEELLQKANHHLQVVCRDDEGYYLTYKSRLDTGLADPNRYSGRRT